MLFMAAALAVGVPLCEARSTLHRRPFRGWIPPTVWSGEADTLAAIAKASERPVGSGNSGERSITR